MSDRLTLALYREDDYPDVHRIMSDADVIFWRRPAMTADETKAWFDARRAETQAGYGWRTLRLADGTFVGQAGLVPLAASPDIQLAYHLVRDQWGQGYATEAAGVLLDYGFRRLWLERIAAVVLPSNTRSLAVMARLGLRATRERLHADLIHRYFTLARADYLARAQAA